MEMADDVINVLISGFAGLDFPRTLSLPVKSNTTGQELWRHLDDRLPSIQQRLILTTVSNEQIPHYSAKFISDFCSEPQDDFLTLRLSVPVLGGKGGFGSQLRAAGGRMSSKRKKNQGENNGSSRNLDGRRLRTVTEAKSLAEYLAIKPKMEREEKQRRRERWEKIVELAEKREAEIKNGANAKLNGKWVEDKEEAGERTRDAVLAAMKAGNYQDSLLSTSNGSSSTNMDDDDVSPGEEEEAEASNSKATTPNSELEERQPKGKARMFFGFDEDDEFMSSDEESGAEDNGKAKGKGKSKGKGKGK